MTKELFVCELFFLILEQLGLGVQATLILLAEADIGIRQVGNLQTK